MENTWLFVYMNTEYQNACRIVLMTSLMIASCFNIANHITEAQSLQEDI